MQRGPDPSFDTPGLQGSRDLAFPFSPSNPGSATHPFPTRVCPGDALLPFAASGTAGSASSGVKATGARAGGNRRKHLRGFSGWRNVATSNAGSHAIDKIGCQLCSLIACAMVAPADYPCDQERHRDVHSAKSRAHRVICLSPSSSLDGGKVRFTASFSQATFAEVRVFPTYATSGPGLHTISAPSSNQAMRWLIHHSASPISAAERARKMPASTAWRGQK